MPEERGSIYKSTANEIGEALKAKLGGEGFAPKDWSKNLNLLGIASEDTEAAINSLKESEGSGERGSILLSTANAIGSMLNKKYNSQRGFSPAEWASATRKMKALETDTKSGGIVNLKGAKEVPITSLIGTINPTLEGTDTLTATRLGKNLANFVNGYGIAGNGTIEPTAARCATIEPIPIIANVTYKAYVENNRGFIIAVWNGNTLVRRTASLASGDTLDTSGGDRFYLCIYGAAGVTCTIETDKPRCLTSDDLDTSYTPYVAPTTYTANLGRTIYGGSADIVNGEGKIKCVKVKFSDLTWYTSLLNGVQQFYALLENTAIPANNRTILDGLLCEEYTVTYADEVYVDTTVGNKLSVNISKYLQLRDFSVSTLEAFKEKTKDYYLVYPLATEEDFTFDPIPINTSGDTENFYTSNGDTSITYYEEPTAYTRGTASGMIASIPEANTEFPFTKLKATIAPSVEGVSSVEMKNEGKNLFSFDKDQTITRLKTFNLRLLAGSYTFSWDFISTTAETLPVYMQVSFLCDDGTTVYNSVDIIEGRMTRSFTLAKNVTSINIYANTNYSTSEGITTVIENIQLEVGSSATQFEPYKQPTTYTANLGETVYGGSVDLVSGEVIDSNDNTFYIDPQEIYPREGVNNIWNNANGITEVGYFGE